MMNDISQRISNLPPEKQELLKLLLQKKKKKTNVPSLKIPKRTTSISPDSNEVDRCSVSFAQQRMWFQDRLGIKSAVSNNISTFLKITGSLKISALEASFLEIIRRHEILRTTLQQLDGELVQEIAPEIQWTLPVIDLRSISPTERDEKVRSIGLEQACKPVDLSKDWCWQTQLLQLDTNDYTLVLTLHHIAVDAWSIGVFFRELSALYDAFSQGKSSPLPELPIQYADFTVWQRQYFQGDVLDRELAYWKQVLKNAPDVLQLPLDRPRPTVQSFTGKTLSFVFPKTLVDGLKQLAQQAETTLFTTLLAGLQTLLFRYTRQEDILIGSPIANRHQPEVESLIGCFINTLVFRSNLSGNPSFCQLLDRVKKTVLGALAHQTLPFETLVDELQLTRNIAYAPLFQVMLVLQNAFSIENIELPGLDVSHSRIDNQTAQFDLTFHLVESDIGLIGKLEYNTDLFDEARMLRMLGHFQTLLNGAIANPETALLELPILTPAELQQLLPKPPQALPPAPTTCIHHLFEVQVRQTPDEIAIVCGDRQITYRDLDRRANQFARYLQKQGIQPERLVGLCLERSIDLFVGLLGILKAGGAYVPLDPAYPSQRLNTILSDAQPSSIVTQAAFVEKFAKTDASQICLDTHWSEIALESSENPKIPVSSENLAYVIYTSGSTGTPKGVAIEHRSLVNFTEAASEEYEISAVDRILQFATIGFDTAVEEIFPALTRGATLVLRTELGSMSGFLNTCRDWNLTVLDLPTAFWHQLATEMSAARRTSQSLTLPDSVRLVIIGGEKALLDRLELWQQQVSSHVRLVNSYGPTEATVVTTTVDLSAFSLAECGGCELPIGTAIRNATTYVLDSHLKPVPVGIPGELYIGGAGIARGYLNRPDLNERAFIRDPFSSLPDARLYKTGDLVCLREEGNVEFLGRIDNQVKIRGFRIELGEIEAALNQHPDIQTSVVIESATHRFRERVVSEGDRQLVGYVVPESQDTPTAPQLRRFLEKRLPKYMVPTAFVTLEALPINVHGKIDRQALPAPEPAISDATDNFVPPQTSTEVAIAEIFAEVLGVDRVGLYDDFFELGGHSLLATKLLSRLLPTLQVELTLVDLFESPTVAGLVERLNPTQSQKSTDRSKLDLDAEVVLDPSIAAGNQVFQWVKNPQQVFLTGATGFLGAFLLVELLKKTQATIYCLVRASDVDLAQQRIQRNLEAYQVWDEGFRDRIVAVPGDLSKPHLGLTIDRFQNLAERIDVIYHNGALVNSIYPYSALKSINVLGTQEVLRLASQTKLKAVHFVSSLSVVYSPDYLDRSVVMEADGFDRWRGLFNGYAQSKWVAEKIAQIARSRGIPVCIYRPGVISGHSQAGVCNTQDFLHTLLKGFIQLQSAPDLDAVWDFTPVDYVSQAIVHLSQQPENLGKVFHLTNPQPLHLSALIASIDSFGYPIEPMLYEPWRLRLVDFVQQSRSSQWESLLPIFPDRLSEDLFQILKLKFDCQNTLQGLKNTSIACPPVDRRLLETYWSYLIDRGFLESPVSS
ncbi:MAG: amino acid adenylation domain-containing protein [Cyanobacteria bacterium SID2]|nr:amino acid adenylation domain-containing protein [Cyanobacteria bacterium SID2]